MKINICFSSENNSPDQLFISCTSVQCVWRWMTVFFSFMKNHQLAVDVRVLTPATGTAVIYRAHRAYRPYAANNMRCNFTAFRERPLKLIDERIPAHEDAGEQTRTVKETRTKTREGNYSDKRGRVPAGGGCAGAEPCCIIPVGLRKQP